MRNVLGAASAIGRLGGNAGVESAATPRRCRVVGLCLFSGLLVSGCSDFSRAIGLEKTSPDEFAVESRAPLTIPPDFDLRPPQPGAARPQEPSAAEKARTALEKAGPGTPGNTASAFALRRDVNGLGSSSTNRADPTAQVGAQSLSAKLLSTQDPGSAVVEKRDTETMKGVY